MVAHAISKSVPFASPEEYLEQERHATARSEYYDGVVVAMAGATPDHNRIVFNLTGLFYMALRGSGCQGFSNDMRVRVVECNRYYYPDLTVVCEKPQYEQLAGMENLLNPSILIEVLSPSTEKIDREEKLDCYRTIPSLRAYLLVSQEQPRMECYTRQESGVWLYESARGLEAFLTIPHLATPLTLSEVYV